MVPVVLVFLVVFQVPGPEIRILREISSPELAGKNPEVTAGQILEKILNFRTKSGFFRKQWKTYGKLREQFQIFSWKIHLAPINLIHPGR